MKMKQFLLFSLIMSFSCLTAQESMNITKLSNWDDDSLPGHFYGTFNDLWGYVDGNDREYAIMGSASYIHFFDVTDPTDPVLIDQFEGGAQTVWRDFKTYANRAYASSDNSGEGIHIFDLSDLPNSVTKTNQVTDFFGSAHNIFIDEPNGRLYAVGVNGGVDIVVLDIATDPDDPALLASIPLPNAGYIHDIYVRDNIAYASHGYGGLFIWDFTNPTDPQYIASFASDNEGYNHSSWVTENGETLIFAEEVPTGLPMVTVDIRDMANDNIIPYNQEVQFPLLGPEYTDNTPHNPYIIGDYVYTSYYEDGVQIIDISDPTNPTLAGYYDTYPSNTEYNGYAGCWGVYPFLPSGNIIASDMSNGLFVLQFDESVNTNKLPENINSFEVSPNPTDGLLKIELKSENQTNAKIILTSLTGQLISEKTVDFNGTYSEWLDISDLPSGMYFLSIGDEKQSETKKIVKN